MNPYREPQKPTSRLKQFFVNRARVSPGTVFLAAVLIAGITLAATPALRLNGLKFGGNDGSVWVTAYGAVGDGVTDSTSAIQAAVTAASTGATVYVPHGTYVLSGSGTELMLINKGIHLECASNGATFQVASTVPNTTDIVHVTSPSTNGGLQINNCTFAATTGASKAVSAATNATPIAVTTATHGYSTGQTVTISGVLGNTNANGTWVITVTGATTFTLNGSVGNAAYTSGGSAVAVPGRHGINLDITSGGQPIQNLQIMRNTIGQFGGRAISVTNTVPAINGLFLMRVEDNILRGGVNLANAGDSLLFKGNTITGGFNAFDVALVQPSVTLGGGAHGLVIEDNNVTSQGCFIAATNGSYVRVFNNNVEPGSTGNYGIDTTSCANNAVIDLAGNSTTPLVGWQFFGNYVANWANNTTNGNLLRNNWTLGTYAYANTFARVAAGPFAYVMTANAIGTRLDIPTTEDGAVTATLVSDAGTRTWTHFVNPDSSEEFGSTTSTNYRMRIRGGTAQSTDLLNVVSNAGTNLIRIPTTNDVLLGAATDNGFPVELGITQATGRVEFAGGTILKRTTVADTTYTTTQADNIIAYTSLTAGRTVTLASSVRTGTIYIVKNETASAFAITLTPSSGTCDGAASCTVTAAGLASSRVYFNGTNWFTF